MEVTIRRHYMLAYLVSSGSILLLEVVLALVEEHDTGLKVGILLVTLTMQ